MDTRVVEEKVLEAELQTISIGRMAASPDKTLPIDRRSIRYHQEQSEN